MRLCARILLALSAVLIASCVSGQEAVRSENPDLLARLSYKTSPTVWRDGVQQVCLAVSLDREYRIIRLANDGQTQRVHGKMEKEQFDRLTSLLRSEKFRALSGNHGALIRQDAETFAAEIPLGDRLRADGSRQWMEHEAWRLQWLNADGESPFPGPVAKIVDWLVRFQPKNGKEFEYAEFPDVCPSQGLQLVQPTVADNQRP
jgi:hypothetical protein